MKRLMFFVLFLIGVYTQAQSTKTPKSYTIDVSQFNGTVVLHNPDISHLITNRPGGFMVGYSRKRFGEKEWEAEYGYPDTGVLFIYQNMNNETLGKHFGLYAHYNFYFFKRNLQFRIGQGMAYTTNPYDKNDNFRNNAYGSDFLSSTILMFNYHKENVINNLGFKAGFSIIHYSNANFKAPNTSTNTLSLNLGLVYNLDDDSEYVYELYPEKDKITSPIKYNLAFRAGVNESDIIDSGQYSFYIFSAYADKRLSRKSAIQFGADVFFSNFLKELINYRATAFPEFNISGNEDYKRVGLFVGHELFVNKISVIAQLGYYVYYPFDFEGRMYNRVGLKRYFGKKVFGELTVKSHGAKAEAVEFGIGVRL